MPRNYTYDPETGEVYIRGQWVNVEDVDQVEAEYDGALEYFSEEQEDEDD